MSTEIPTDILAFVAEVEALVNDATPGPWTDDNGDIIAPDGRSRRRIATTWEDLNSHFITHARSDVPTLVAIVREQAERIAALESPDGENRYDGCLCGGISPEDKPCLTCAARLSQWDAMAAELALRRKRRFIGRHEEETGVYCGDYNQHRETGWACNACGVFSRNEHDACENCDNDFIRLENENRGLRERIAKLESEGAALFASEQAAVWLATEASALAVSSGERLAKLESLGLWIEVERAAEQELADKTDGSPGMVHAGRADAFSQVGQELNNRADKDLRKETPQ